MFNAAVDAINLCGVIDKSLNDIDLRIESAKRAANE